MYILTEMLYFTSLLFQNCEGRVDVGQINADSSPQRVTCLDTPVPGRISGDFLRCVRGKKKMECRVFSFLFLVMKLQDRITVG